VLECASFCAEPYGGKETVLGEITADAVVVTAMHPDQRCTVASVAGHAMYERSNPYFEHVAAGRSTCRIAATSRWTRAARASPARIPARAEFRVKLEGAGRIGERYVGMVGIRDPYTIAHVDQVIGWARDKVRERFGPEDKAATASTTTSTVATASWASASRCAIARRTSSAYSCRAWPRPPRWRRRSA
jgi:hypothetical protein